MADHLANLPEQYTVDEFGNPIRLAWGVILVAFAGFCIICVASTLWLQYFFFQSSVQLSTRLQVGSGIIGVQAGSSAEQTATGERSISTGTLIRTDGTNALSQATITFRDANYDDRLVASVTLMGDTSIRFDRALRPRFEWTSSFYNLELQDLNGIIHIVVADDLRHDFELSVTDQSLDTDIRIVGTGRYVVRSQAGQLEVTNRDGQLLFLGPSTVAARSVPPGYQGIYSPDADQIRVEQVVVNLLENSQLEVFEPQDYESVGSELSTILRGWDCSTDYEFQNRLPLGNYQEATSPDGREVLRMVRTGASNNVGTGCRQDFPGEGVEVAGFDDLRLQAMVYVDSQSISGCGERASECPLMMRVRFMVPQVDEDNQPILTDDGSYQYIEQQWIHGVYAMLDPNSPWPLICDTCRRDHVRVYEDTWYIYDSGNLFNVFQFEDQPASIRVREIEFYASGHDYDVYVSEIALLGRTNTVSDAR